MLEWFSRQLYSRLLSYQFYLSVSCRGVAHLNIIHIPSKASQVGPASLVTALGWVEVHGVRHIVDFSDQALN